MAHPMDIPGLNRFFGAAQAVSKALSKLGVKHAFIGGFAVNLLGRCRRTDDIDVAVLDTTDAVALQGHLQESDSTFAIHNDKLVFVPQDGRKEIPIDLHRTCDLGLPQTLDVIHYYALPILTPAFLVLSKIKHWAAYAGSNCPDSVREFEVGLLDIHSLLVALDVEGKSMDFAGYHGINKSAAKDGLYLAVAKLARHCEEKQLVLSFHFLGNALALGDKVNVVVAYAKEYGSAPPVRTGPFFGDEGCSFGKGMTLRITSFATA